MIGSHARIQRKTGKAKKRTVAAAALLAALSVASAAQAIEIETVQQRMPVDTQGTEKTLLCATMDNGQRLYLTSALGEEIGYKLEDVNFDGYADFVTFPTHGARNIFAEFYPYQPETDEYVYAPVWNGQLCNYELDAQRQYVFSQVGDGARDGDWWIYRWKDGHLEPVRRMRVASYEEFTFTDNGYTSTLDGNRYEIVITDYTQDVNGVRLFEQVYEDSEWEETSTHIYAALETLHAGLE